MARRNTNAELWSNISSVSFVTHSTSGIITTLSAAAVVGAVTLGLTSVVGLSTVDDEARVGDDSNWELVKFDTSTTGSIKSGIAYAHSSGEVVNGTTRVDVGAVSDDGASLEVETERTAINVATQRHRHANHTAHTNFKVSFMMEHLSAENFLFAMGIPDSNLTGAGTSVDPTVADWTPDNIDTIDPLAIVLAGALKNGETYEIQLWRCSIDGAKTLQLARGQDAPIPIVVDAEHYRIIGPTA